MKCQNCGFESDNKICSVCGAEIDETQADALQTHDASSDTEPEEQNSTEEEAKKPKKSVRKILLAVLLIVLSVVIVSASSIGIFYYFTNDSRTEFKKINQTVSLGDFSVKLKEVRTPEFVLEYYPRICYDAVFEIQNNTGESVQIARPQITAFCCESGEEGYFYNYTYFEIDGEESKMVTAEIPAWSSVDFTGQIYYEDYSDDLYGYYDDALNSTYDGDDSDAADSISGDEQENGDEIIIDEGKITYKKEGLQKYKDNSPESFYLILSLNKHFEEEKHYSRFLIEPDKQAIQIPEGENIQ